MLTRAGFVTLIGSAMVVGAGRLFGLPELFILGAAGLLVVALAIGYVAVRRLQVEVSRQLSPPRVHAGNPCRVDLLLRNGSRVSSPVVRLRDDVSGTQGVELLVAPMRSGAGTQAVYRLPTDRRGLVKVGPLRLTVTDPFGLARLTTTGDRDVSLIVYPRLTKIDAVQRSSGSDLERQTVQEQHVAPLGDEFYALREYVVGDDLRRVHWPSSARHDELMVRQDEIPWHGRLTVLLDTRRGPTSSVFEDMVSAAASLLNASVGRGDQVRLLTTSGHDSGFGTGASHLERLLEVLALVEADDSSASDALSRMSGRGAGGALVAFAADGSEIDEAVLRRGAGAYRRRTLVQFGSTGATGVGASGPLRSTTVIVVTPDVRFSEAWAAAFGRSRSIGA